MLTLFKTSPTNDARPIPQESLEDVMMELLNYGQPRVGVYSSDMTWHCTVDMNTNTVGSDFKVRSEWNHTTPLDAAKLCRDRVVKAVSIYKEIK